MTPKRSEIVQALADIASQGTYTVKPAVARQMNVVFDLTATLINELEAEEQAKQDAAHVALEEEENDS